MTVDPRVRFVDELKQLLALAGATQADLQRQDPEQLRQTTVSRLLAGNFTRVPPWERVAAFVTACVHVGHTKKLTMPPQDMLLGQWRHRHEALVFALEQGSPGDSCPPVEGTAAPPEQRRRRRFGAVPPRAGAFQRRTVAAALTRSIEGGGTTVLTGAATTTPASVLTGLGGVGKTQLAADHAHTVWDNQEVDLLVWISARTRDAITAGYTDVAVELLGQDPIAPDQACRRLLEWLAETSDPWLVVLDDVQDPSHLTGLWPPHSAAGQVVVTTRCRDAALRGDRREVLDVDLFTPDEAMDYLTDKLPDHARTGAEDLAGLADDLGYLPLALAQAAAYLINKPLLACAAYRARLADRRGTLQDVLPTDRDLPDEHEKTVAVTWSLSIEAADQLDPAGLALPVLELASLLDPAGIPIMVFTTDAVTSYVSALLEQDITAETVAGGLEALHRFSLLALDQRQPHASVRVHALVQRAVRETLAAAQLSIVSRALADALTQTWPEVDRDTGLATVLRDNTDQLIVAAGDCLIVGEAHPVLFRMGRSIGEAGQVVSAIDYHRTLITATTERLGPDHPDSLTARHQLAFWQGEAGDQPGAVTAFRTLLEDRLRVLGPEHPDTLSTRDNLAFRRGRAGDPYGAERAFSTLLSDYIRILGPEHPSTLTIRHNLAYWRGHAGDPQGAAAALLELLPSRTQVSGPDDARTLATRHNLAYWQGQGGEVSKAVAGFQELLEDRVRISGPEHPHTFAVRHNLAYWRAKAGDISDAVTELDELLADYHRVLGPAHPHTNAVRDSLAKWRSRL
ncbi:FxSxx-COOH system tetratricopeptide repeat protein [Amycolatopsis speibonae]|uniref:FxSxx-COOH system tetratricopeptide repeat protein n=1 Tax=Amycolatopsis speibonae TaxID=1450224 RepID=A0ABV7P3A6_9PSEU